MAGRRVIREGQRVLDLVVLPNQEHSAFCSSAAISSPLSGITCARLTLDWLSFGEDRIGTTPAPVENSSHNLTTMTSADGVTPHHQASNRHDRRGGAESEASGARRGRARPESKRIDSLIPDTNSLGQQACARVNLKQKLTHPIVQLLTRPDVARGDQVFTVGVAAASTGSRPALRSFWRMGFTPSGRCGRVFRVCPVVADLKTMDGGYLEAG